MVCEILSYHALARYEPHYAVLFFSASGWWKSLALGRNKAMNVWHHDHRLYTIAITEERRI